MTPQQAFEEEIEDLTTTLLKFGTDHGANHQDIIHCLEFILTLHRSNVELSKRVEGLEKEIGKTDLDKFSAKFAKALGGL